MDRRGLIVLASVAAVALPAIGTWGQSVRTYRLGILINGRDAGSAALLKGLSERGYAEGKNLIVEWRFSQGVAERWPALANELVALKVDAIYVQTTPAALAAKRATSTIPIIIPTAIDPVGTGLAASLARPGGNVTGLSMLQPEITGKALSLLKEAAPQVRRVTVLWNEGNPAFAPVWQNIETTAGSDGLTLARQPVRDPQDFDAAFAALAAEPPAGLLVLIDALMVQNLSRVAEFTVRQHLPAVSTVRSFPERGGLLSYGPDDLATQRKAAVYVDRVFKGENPGDLPFEQPTTFQLVINLKAAKALGLTLPPLLLTRADEVIE